MVGWYLDFNTPYSVTISTTAGKVSINSGAYGTTASYSGVLESAMAALQTVKFDMTGITTAPTVTVTMGRQSDSQNIQLPITLQFTPLTISVPATLTAYQEMAKSLAGTVSTASTATVSVTVTASSGTVNVGAGAQATQTRTLALAALQTALGSMVYTGNPGFYGTDTITFQFARVGTSLTASGSTTVTVVRKPTITLPGSVAVVTENTASVSVPASVTVYDGTCTTLSLDVSVNRGKFSMPGVVSVPQVSASPSGTVAALNSGLAGLTLYPPADFYGDITLYVKASCPSQAPTEVTAVVVSVTALPLVVTPPAGLSVQEGDDLLFAVPLSAGGASPVCLLPERGPVVRCSCVGMCGRCVACVCVRN